MKRRFLAQMPLICLGLVAGCGPIAPGLGGSAGGTGTMGATGTSGTATGAGPTSTGASAGPSSDTLGPGPTSLVTGDPSATDSAGYLDTPGDTTVDPCPNWAAPGCATNIAMSQVVGSTPLGAVDLPVAMFGAHMGCQWCVEQPNVQRVYFVGDLADLPPDPWGDLTGDTLVLGLAADSFEGPIGQVVLGDLSRSLDGMIEYTGGVEFVLDQLPTAEQLGDPFDPARAATVSGTFSVQNNNGWNVTGMFEAGYCPQLNQGYICE